METIRIDRSQAETLIRFLDKCREAERFFEVCQGPSYRRFVSNALADPALAAAHQGLRESLSVEPFEEKTEQKKPVQERIRKTSSNSADKYSLSVLSDKADSGKVTTANEQ
jgi:hypothetical protein